jgi:hypoxanthine phosphoribosyltransferase
VTCASSEGSDDDIKGKDVVIEDIIDTGYTLNKAREILSCASRNPAICTLLDKPSCREVQVPVDWLIIPDESVGCGMTTP